MSKKIVYNKEAGTFIRITSVDDTVYINGIKGLPVKEDFIYLCSSRNITLKGTGVLTGGIRGIELKYDISHPVDTISVTHPGINEPEITDLTRNPVVELIRYFKFKTKLDKPSVLGPITHRNEATAASLDVAYQNAKNSIIAIPNGFKWFKHRLYYFQTGFLDIEHKTGTQVVMLKGGLFSNFLVSLTGSKITSIKRVSKTFSLHVETKL